MDLWAMAKERVCTKCAGKLEITLMDDFDYLTCPSCHENNNGCSPDLYQMAKAFAEYDNPWCFDREGTILPGETGHIRCDISRMVAVIRWVRRYEENVAKEKYDEMVVRLRKEADKRGERNGLNEREE